MTTYAIVGAGQTAAVAARTLRRRGFDGRIELIGAESHRPYQRPPLTKEFLAGDDRPIRRTLEQQMREAASEERFEDAARYRNRLHAIERLSERQAVERRWGVTIDVIGVAVTSAREAVPLFPLR